MSKGAGGLIPEKRHAARPCHCHQPPIRTLTAISPSGIGIWFSKFSEGNAELSWGCGNVTALEHQVFWRAKLAAEKPGVASWNKAVGILTAGGFRVLA